MGSNPTLSGAAGQPIEEGIDSLSALIETHFLKRHALTDGDDHVLELVTRCLCPFDDFLDGRLVAVAKASPEREGEKVFGKVPGEVVCLVAGQDGPQFREVFELLAPHQFPGSIDGMLFLFRPVAADGVVVFEAETQLVHVAVA